MGPAGGQLGPAAPLQLGEEASDWLLFPGPVPGGGGGGAGSCLLACYLVLWHCGTGGTVALWHMSLSARLSLCPYEPKFL